MGTVAAARCDEERRCCNEGECCNGAEDYGVKCPESAVFANTFNIRLKRGPHSKWVSAKPVMDCPGKLVIDGRSEDLAAEDTNETDALREACTDDHRWCSLEGGFHEVESLAPISDRARDATVFADPKIVMAASGACSADAAASLSDEVALVQGVETLSPQLVNQLLKSRTCRLIDLRGADRAAGLIRGAESMPAFCTQAPFPARLPELVNRCEQDRLIVFFCQFCKHRAPCCANLFRQQTDSAGNTMQRVAIMDGGFRAWQKAGLPVHGECKPSEQATADAFALSEGMMVVSGRAA